MKAIAYLALIAALGAPALVIAQEVDAGAAAGAAAGATAGSTSATGNGSASVGGSADLGSMDELTTHLGASATVTLDLSAVTPTTTMHIVKVSTLEASASGNVDSFKAASPPMLLALPSFTVTSTPMR